MKASKANTATIVHRTLLSRTIETELWLRKMAANGDILAYISGSKYHFKTSAPQNVDYFIMTPEIGANSDSWVYYEFQQKMGERIPHDGSSLFAPSHVLIVHRDISSYDPGLAEYYYKHRNYRLARRFLRNAVASFVFLLIGVTVCICAADLLAYALALGLYLLGAGILFAHFVWSFAHFYRACIANGFGDPLKKPRRPGH